MCPWRKHTHTEHAYTHACANTPQGCDINTCVRAMQALQWYLTPRLLSGSTGHMGCVSDLSKSNLNPTLR